MIMIAFVQVYFMIFLAVFSDIFTRADILYIYIFLLQITCMLCEFYFHVQLLKTTGFVAFKLRFNPRCYT